jgi:hypothetical protein
MTLDLFFSSHNCSGSDVTYDILSRRHDTIFNGSEVASIHSFLYMCGEYTAKFRIARCFSPVLTALLGLCKKLRV